MSTTCTILPDRGVVSVTGEDARTFLQNLITNDLDLLTVPGSALHAALLTPQGKILFEFFVVPMEGGFLLETGHDKAPDLVKRLTMYKLRAKVTIADRSSDYAVLAAWREPGSAVACPQGALTYRDPRREDFAARCLVPPSEAVAEHLEAYTRRRVALTVPEPPHDYTLGDTFPHEANMDHLNGVSFSKGCFVGQEVVSRMQNKSVVRKRVVRVSGTAPLTSGADILVGSAVIGRIGTVADREALAMVRLDRAAEAEDKGQKLLAGGVEVTVAAESLAAYRKSVAERPIINL